MTGFLSRLKMSNQIASAGERLAAELGHGVETAEHGIADRDRG
jgi:hypothetical protein